MAIPIETTTPPHSLLTTLRAVQRSQQTRTSLSHELDGQYSSFLSQTASPLDLSLSPSTTEEIPLTTCQLEAVRPPNEIEMNEILRISFVGMMEVRNEIQEHIEMLRTVWKREDLVKVVTELERLEGDRLKATIERDTLLRLAELEDGDFDQALVESNKRRVDLAVEISESLDEIQAEIAELLAVEP